MTPNAIARLPNISDARLPATYERAREALALCTRLDECKDWADKAAALASYAKQADDRSLYTLAVRIQSRAMRRAGELLEEFQTSSRGGRPSKNGGDAPTVSQRRVAADAGLSKDQEVNARRVASIPVEDFEEAIESDEPPTMTALAERGTEKRERPPVPPEFAAATYLIARLHDLAGFMTEHPAPDVAAAVLSSERARVGDDLGIVETWLSDFFDHLPEGTC